MNSHTCSLCQVLFWKACCVPKVKQGCSKGNPEQRSRCAIFSGWMGGEKLARICGRRGPLPQGSKKKRKKASNVCLERPRRSSLLTVHRYASQWSILFFFFRFVFYFTGCMMSKCYFCLVYHVLCVCLFSWCGCVCICKVLFLPLLGDIMHGVCVCILVSVLFSLRCRCTEDQQAHNGITFLKLLFWENPRHECLGQGGRAVSTPKYCCSIAFHPQLNLQSLALCRRLKVPPQALCCPPAP